MEQLIRALDPRIWFAGYFITSNYADTDFAVVACSLILSGKRAFEDVMTNPAGLASRKIPKGVPVAKVRTLFSEPHNKKTGKKLLLKRDFRARFAAAKALFVRETVGIRRTTGVYEELKSQFWNRQDAQRGSAQAFERLRPIAEPLAENGHPGAQLYLGCVYWLGKGTPKDIDKAIRYEGRGANMDLCEAHRWLAKAAANGSEPAKEKLAKMALNGAA